MKRLFVVVLGLFSIAAPVPLAVARTPSLWQGKVTAIRSTSITVGHVTCARSVPLDLRRFRVGELVVMSCQAGKLVGIGLGHTGLYMGTVPIAPAA